MPRKTDWAFAQIPAQDPHQGQYKGSLMNYPTWWIDPDYVSPWPLRLPPGLPRFRNLRRLMRSTDAALIRCWCQEDDLHDQSLHAEVAHVSLLLQLQYPLGPWQLLHPGETFASFKSCASRRLRFLFVAGCAHLRFLAHGTLLAGGLGQD